MKRFLALLTLSFLSCKTDKTKISHQEEWDFYITNIDNKPSSIATDLGLHSIAPLADKPNVAWVSLKMNIPREDGLSSDKEIEILGKIEDALSNWMIKEYNATYTGRLTSDNHRDFYFYLKDTIQLEKNVSKLMKQFPDYEYSYGIKEDKTWSGYFDFLYPNPKQFEEIQNRKVVDNLEKQGDELTKQRQVDHWIYFNNEKNREAFLQKINGKGFKTENKSFDKSLGEYPYGLHISRIDKIDLESVNQYTIYLWETAAQFNGDYDGWETSVEK